MSFLVHKTLKIFNEAVCRLSPGIALIFGFLGRMTVGPSKTGRGSIQEPQNMRKVGNTGTETLGATQGFQVHSPSPWIELQIRKLIQSQASWEPVMLTSNGRMTPGRHGRP